MARVDIVSKSRISDSGNYVKITQDTRAYTQDDETLRDVSGNLVRTSNGTSELAYDIYKKKR